MRISCLCLVLCALHGVSTPASAQPRELPEWVVPVLRLVSSTHVEPTTGVVLSADGLVLVAAEFAAPGDEIVVLDGGRDIVRNGRPARLEAGFPELGLEVLRVDGLRRPAAPVAPGAPAEGGKLWLRAFPPAEQIAEGALPVSAEASFNLAPESDTPSLPAGASLPNVTGPLLDACGNLAAFSLAEGVQTLAPAAGTAYRWHNALQAVLAELKLPLTGSPCGAVPANPDLLPEQPEEAEAQPASARPPPAETSGEEAREEQEEDASTGIEPSVELLPPFEEDFVEDGDQAVPVETTESPPSWPWLAAAILMLALGGSIWLLRRRSRGDGSAPERAGGAASATVQEPGRDSADNREGRRPDCRLVLRGRLAAGPEFEIATEVSAHAINVEIGRGGADLVIDSPSVSRRHARLNGTRDALTLTDLGSSNGSSINGVPCMEGEIMYLENGDQVVLGDACFSVSVEDAREPGGAG